MSVVPVKILLESGVHFGHRVSRWNPKMKPFIYGKRNLIHIIDLRQTMRGLIRATHFLSKLASQGEPILIVGTKRQAKNVVIAESKKCGMPCVAERWIGGTLTNFSTIRGRLRRLEEIETQEKSGHFEALTKKEVAGLLREKRKLLRNLEGIRDLSKLPGALVIVDPKREHIALSEANKLGIPAICIIDTDSDPDLVDIPIPGNDDAMRSIQVLLEAMTNSIIGGRSSWKDRSAADEKRERERETTTADAGPPRRPQQGGGRPGGGGGGPRRGGPSGPGRPGGGPGGPGGGRQGGGGQRSTGPAMRPQPAMSPDGRRRSPDAPPAIAPKEEAVKPGPVLGKEASSGAASAAPTGD